MSLSDLRRRLGGGMGLACENWRVSPLMVGGGMSLCVACAMIALMCLWMRGA